MLQKVISIKSVGRFLHASPKGDVTFRRYTLIYAENGRGKTTLCAILRSLLTNSPTLIAGRKTLGSMDKPDVELRLADGMRIFRNGKWSSCFTHLHLYDSKYVTENVFAGDVVETEHRRNLYRVIIGAAGVSFAARVNERADQITAKNDEIKDTRTAIQRHIPLGVSFDQFIAFSKDETVDANIAAQEQKRQAVQQAVQLQQKSGLTAVPIPEFPTHFPELLAKTFAVIAASAQQQVKEHLARHRMQANGETWLNQGLRYVTDDACPFCGQSLASVALIQSYNDYFNREYDALSTELTQLNNQIIGAIGEHATTTIRQVLSLNASSLEFWSIYCKPTPPVKADTHKVKQVLSSLMQAAQALLTIKAATPLAAILPDEHFTKALHAFNALRSSIADYNTAVEAANAVIQAKKRDTEAANIHDIDRSIMTLKAQKARHTDEVARLVASDTRLQQEKLALEEQKKQAKEQLDAHTKQIIIQYGNSINRYLKGINAGFRITIPTHNYKGITPNTTYQIIINEHKVDLGDAKTPADQPSFGNTLSSGDRNTLALAFFLAELEHDQSGHQKVVVLDDPFSSLDGFRRQNTASQLFKCGQRCAQLVVLSHESSFLKLLRDLCPSAETKCLQLARIGDHNTTIGEWDIEKAVQPRYHADLHMLSAYLTENQGKPCDVVQKLRPVLESYCRSVYPALFTEQDMMGVIVDKIRDTDPSHPLHPYADDIDDINIYCRRYHHGDNANAALEPLDESELSSFVERTLTIVGWVSA